MNCSESELLFLDVGGRHFTTGKQILLRSYRREPLPPEHDAAPEENGENFFTSMWSNRWAMTDREGRYCIDRDPDLFDAILYFQRYGKFSPDKKVDMNALCDEMHFYGLSVPYCSCTLRWFQHLRTVEENNKSILNYWSKVPDAVRVMMARMQSLGLTNLIICDELEKVVSGLSVDTGGLPPALKVKVAVAIKDFMACPELLRLLFSDSEHLFHYLLLTEHHHTIAVIKRGQLKMVNLRKDLDYKLEAHWDSKQEVGWIPPVLGNHLGMVSLTAQK